MQKYFQLQTHAVSWRHGGELSLFCWWSQKPDSSVIKHFNHSDQTAKQDIYTKLRVNILKDDQIKKMKAIIWWKMVSISQRKVEDTKSSYLHIIIYLRLWYLWLLFVNLFSLLNQLRSLFWKRNYDGFYSVRDGLFPNTLHQIIFANLVYKAISIVKMTRCLFRLKWNGFLVHLCCYHTLVTEK